MSSPRTTSPDVGVVEERRERTEGVIDVRHELVDFIRVQRGARTPQVALRRDAASDARTARVRAVVRHGGEAQPEGRETAAALMPGDGKCAVKHYVRFVSSVRVCVICLECKGLEVYRIREQGRIMKTAAKSYPLPTPCCTHSRAARRKGEHPLVPTSM